LGRYCDLGSYGGGELRGAPTPRLDQLAREGLRLTSSLSNQPAPRHGRR
jgi:arylsulfatase